MTNPDHRALFDRCQSNPDLYYFCRKIEQAGQPLPADLSKEHLMPILQKLGLTNSGTGYVKIDLRDPIWNEIEEDNENDLPESAVGADRAFVGTVSFRADCPSDVDSLLTRIKSKYAGAWRTTERDAIDAAKGMPDTEVELEITAPLTIGALYREMKHVEDGHVMAETLRALPLTANSLERRSHPTYFDRQVPRDFSER